MRKATAAAYCDLSVGTFEHEIVNGKLPSSFMLGGREHWDRRALDTAIDRLSGAAEEPEYLREWREKYDEPTRTTPTVSSGADGRQALTDQGRRYAYSTKTLAERWSCSAELVRKLVKEGKLARVPAGNLIRISADEVHRYEAGEK